jgi:hypothetical protein
MYINSNVPNGLALNGPGGSTPQYAVDSQGIVHYFPQYAPILAPGLGLWAETRSTNYALQSRDFTQAVWTKTNVTATKNQIGADLTANGASLLTATAANATVTQASANPATATNLITSVWMKRVTGTGTVSLCTDGSTYTDISGQLSTTKFTRVNIPAQNLSAPTFGIKFGTSGDVVVADFFQCENCNTLTSVPTNPNPSVATAVNRGSTCHTFASNQGSTPFNDGQRILHDVISSGKPWCVYSQFSCAVGTNVSAIIASDGNLTEFTGTPGTTGATFKSAVTANYVNLGQGTVNKWLGRVTGGTSSVCLNGGIIATANNNSTSLPPGPTSHLVPGDNGSGGACFSGYTMRIAFWDKPISDDQMINLTRVVNNQ